MKLLFTLFWHICLFRRSPADVPYAPALTCLLVLAVALLDAGSVLAMNALSASLDAAQAPPPAMIQVLVEWLMMAGWMLAIYGLLRFKGLQARLLQTLTAALGTDILLALPQILCFALLAVNSPESVLAALAQLALIFFMVWDMLVKGQIYAIALNISRLQGNLLSLALSFGLFALGTALFSPPQ